MKNPIDKLTYERARSRANELKAFYMMLIGYCLMVPFWIFINHQTSPGFQWFWFPTIGCGISIIAYGIYLFAAKNWERNMIIKLMEKDQYKH